MLKNIYDVAIVGAGVAGAFASLRIAEKYKNTNTILIDLGRPPGKRRRFLEGWFGAFPTGDGKIYPSDADNVLQISDGRKVKSINKWVSNYFKDAGDFTIIKTKRPNQNILKKINSHNFGIQFLDFIQWKPNSIHQLSRNISNYIEDVDNITYNFDNEVFSIEKNNEDFIIFTNNGEIICKKIILCVGRSGWRWSNTLFRDLDILQSDNTAKFGVTIEIAAQYVKNFNKSHCILSRDNLLIGPLSWNGSVIQEDHVNLTTAAFRSNEARWKTDKLFFSLIGYHDFPGEGCKQTDRIAQLSFLLAGERVGREKVRSIIRKSSQISMIPEYNWLIPAIEELDEIIPNIINRGFFHYPDILPLTSRINIKNNLETDIDGLFVAGENTGVKGILSAALTGGIAADNVVK